MRPVDLASRLNLLQLAIWTTLALWVVPARAHFLYDEAYFYHQAVEVARHGAFPVYGPPVSGTTPTAFTPGGAAYVVLAIPFLFGTDPRLGAAWLIVLSSLAVWCLDRALKGFGTDPASRVFTVAVLTWSTWHVRVVDRIWNNHLLWPLSLFLLATTLLLMTRPAARSRGLMALFGVISAVLVQAHLQGALAVAACGFLILTAADGHRNLRRWLPAVAGCGVLYLPYAASEIVHRFQNTGWMHSAHAFAEWNLGAVARGVVAPFWFQSLFPFTLIAPQPLQAALSGTSTSHWVRVAVSFLAIGVSACCSFRRTPLRRFVLICWLLIPVYFLVIQREYHDHYLYSLAPFFVMPLGLGLGTLFRRSQAFSVVSCVFLAVWIGVHTEHWVPEYLTGLHRPTLASQLRRAEAAAKAPSALQVQSGDPDVFIVWSLAKNRFKRDLLFYVVDLGRPCRIEIGPRRPNARAPVVSWDSFFRCS